MLDHIKEGKSGDHAPAEHGDDSERLDTKKLPAAAKEKPITGCPRGKHILSEKTNCKGAPAPTNGVGGNGSHRVVNAKHLVKENHGKDYENTADKPNPNGAASRHKGTRCGYGHKPCNDTV